jgi:Protein of unknown function (DUF1559)
MRCNTASSIFFSTLAIGSLFALSTACADDPPPLLKKDIDTSRRNLQKIGVAFQNFNDAYDTLPGNIAAKDGAPLLSWRVAILPYVGETALFNQFKRDEPWNSKHNFALLPKMPKVYEPVRVKAKAGETFYQVFVGTDALFGSKKKYSIFDVAKADGTSQTGMVFEAGEPVIWTKPADMTFDKKLPLPKLGGMFDGEFHVLRVDGSVIRIKKMADEKELKNFIMPDDGNEVDFKKLEWGFDS